MVEMSCCSCSLVPPVKGATKSCQGWELSESSIEVDWSAVSEEGDSAGGEEEVKREEVDKKKMEEVEKRMKQEVGKVLQELQLL